MVFSQRPVGKRHRDATGDKNNGIDERQTDILELAQNFQDQDTNGLVSSNFEGWHSARNIHLNNSSAMKWLVRKISQTSAGLIRQLSSETGNLEILLKECWFNINTYGAWNMPHTHPAWWSGVLYINGDFTVEGGDITFFNPVPNSIKGGYPPHLTVKPEPGLMLLFPGHILHMVTPYKGKSPRVSLSFNIDPSE